MICETSLWFSIRINSRTVPMSEVVAARVIRNVSRDRLRVGTCAAGPINPFHTFCQRSGWSLCQRFGKSSRSNCPVLIDRIASVCCGSHSRLRGDFATSGKIIASNAIIETTLK